MKLVPVPAEMTHGMVAAMWLEAAGKVDHEVIRRMWRVALANAPKACPERGLPDVSVELTCHNSKCVAYAHEVTVYEGWRT